MHNPLIECPLDFFPCVDCGGEADRWHLDERNHAHTWYGNVNYVWSTDAEAYVAMCARCYYRRDSAMNVRAMAAGWHRFAPVAWPRRKAPKPKKKARKSKSKKGST